MALWGAAHGSYDVHATWRIDHTNRRGGPTTMRLLRVVLAALCVAAAGVVVPAGPAAAQDPQIFVQKGFPSTIMALHGVTTMTLDFFSLAEVTDVALTDPLPAGLEVASPPNVSNSCGGSVT